MQYIVYVISGSDGAAGLLSQAYQRLAETRGLAASAQVRILCDASFLLETY